MAKPSILIKSVTEKKDFSYSKGDVNLNFTLRVDNSSQLRPFLDILNEAKKDIEELLKGMKN